MGSQGSHAWIIRRAVEPFLTAGIIVPAGAYAILVVLDQKVVLEIDELIAQDAFFVTKNLQFLEGVGHLLDQEEGGCPSCTPRYS